MNYIFSTALVIFSVSAFGQDAETILKKADDVRNPALNYRLHVRIETPEEDTVELEVDIKGKDKTLTKTLKPARDQGRKILMLGEEMWAFVPNLKRSVRVSLNQKLSGQAANGDICRQRWAGDYHAKIESQSKNEWILMLTAKSKNLTYDKIRLHVQKKTYRPIKAQYLTQKEKILKHAKFENYRKMRGAMRPTKTVITSATNAADLSNIVIVDMKPMDFPETQFDQNNLK